MVISISLTPILREWRFRMKNPPKIEPQTPPRSLLGASWNLLGPPGAFWTFWYPRPRLGASWSSPGPAEAAWGLLGLQNYMHTQRHKSRPTHHTLDKHNIHTHNTDNTHKARTTQSTHHTHTHNTHNPGASWSLSWYPSRAS